jgi:hypothetical protein
LYPYLLDAAIGIGLFFAGLWRDRGLKARHITDRPTKPGDRQRSVGKTPVGGLPVPIATAESDPPRIGAGTHEMAAAFRGRCNESPPFLSVSCHNHVSEVASIDTADDRAGHEILGFAERLVE